MNAYGLIVMDLRHTLPNIHYFIQAILTTSITSGPTSMSVLSISSYANGDRTPERRHRKDHNHLTLQPTQHDLPHPPSPSLSFHSPKSSVSYSSSAAFLKSAPQAVAAPTILDPVTTSSRHSTATPCGDSSG
jgi:hypothetical protein